MPLLLYEVQYDGQANRLEASMQDFQVREYTDTIVDRHSRF